MKMTFSSLTVLTLLLVSLLSGCKSATKDASLKLDGTDWQLLELNGKGLPTSMLITLGFKDGQAGGKAPCNSYSAIYTQDGSNLSFDQAVSTMMYCEGVMETETEFLSALGKVTSMQFENNRLRLVDESRAVTLVFGKK